MSSWESIASTEECFLQLVICHENSQLSYVCSSSHIFDGRWLHYSIISCYWVETSKWVWTHCCSNVMECTLEPFTHNVAQVRLGCSLVRITAQKNYQHQMWRHIFRGEQQKIGETSSSLRNWHNVFWRYNVCKHYNLTGHTRDVPAPWCQAAGLHVTIFRAIWMHTQWDEA